MFLAVLTKTHSSDVLADECFMMFFDNANKKQNIILEGGLF